MVESRGVLNTLVTKAILKSLLIRNETHFVYLPNLVCLKLHNKLKNKDKKFVFNYGFFYLQFRLTYTPMEYILKMVII